MVIRHTAATELLTTVITIVPIHRLLTGRTTNFPGREKLKTTMTTTDGMIDRGDAIDVLGNPVTPTTADPHQGRRLVEHPVGAVGAVVVAITHRLVLLRGQLMTSVTGKKL